MFFHMYIKEEETIYKAPQYNPVQHNTFSDSVHISHT